MRPIALGNLAGMLLLVAGGQSTILSAQAAAEPHGAMRAGSGIAPARYRGSSPIVPAPDGTLFCEAEEFTVEKPGWEARAWGENYYAATFANSFLSRKAFLGAPEGGEETVATI